MERPRMSLDSAVLAVVHLVVAERPVAGIVGRAIRVRTIVVAVQIREVAVISLPFESRPWDSPLNTEGWQEFRVGTCRGQWRSTPDSYELLGIKNHTPGNGHFREAMLWFEQSCIRDGKILRIREVWNADLAGKLLKHGFTYARGDDMIKRFKT